MARKAEKQAAASAKRQQHRAEKAKRLEATKAATTELSATSSRKGVEGSSLKLSTPKGRPFARSHRRRQARSKDGSIEPTLVIKDPQFHALLNGLK